MIGLLKGVSALPLEGISGRQGMLFSSVTLDKFIDEEYRHDRFDLTLNQKRSLRTLSNGEQKKALLDYLLDQKPDFLVVDNPFDCLDQRSVEAFKDRLINLTKTTPVLQIFKRRDDLLPFITHIVNPENNSVKPVQQYIAENENKNRTGNHLSIPPALSAPIEIHDPLVEFRNVSVNYGNRKILNNINWTIRKGEFWQLTGPNGAGKSTLLSMIYGNNPKAFGADLSLFGRQKGSGESVWEIKKKIGYFSPSSTELFSRRNSAEQMVISGLTDSIGLYKKPTAIQLELAHQWLNIIKLTNFSGTPFNQLNQLHQRLVMIVRAMIKHPPLLILDEPSTGLDDAGAATLTQLINSFANESRTAIIYVSHRKEKGLKPQKILQLSPSEQGSTGTLIN